MGLLQSLFPTSPSVGQVRPVFLLILDGWGLAPPSLGNPIALIHLKNLQKYIQKYPNGELIAAGESVGLPANEVGNTEVGHLTIGAGRVIFQGLKRINISIEDHSFLRNPAFWQAVEHVQQHQSQLHIIGIISSGNVHGSLPHFEQLIELCRRAQLPRVFVHAFTDGRDAPPKEAYELLNRVEQQMIAAKTGRFATVSGRYYGMDRDRRWERVEKAYKAMVEGIGPTASNISEAIERAYDAGVTDELIVPTVITENNAPIATINDNDACIFINFRIDRARELTMALTMPNFENFDQVQMGFSEGNTEAAQNSVSSHPTFQRNKVAQNLFFVTMTNYHKNLPVQAIAFDTPVVTNPLSAVLAANNVKQLHMAESEKERFVTYYFNGLSEDTFPGENVIIIPSPKVSTYDKKPEMSVHKLVEVVKKQLAKDEYNFFVMNIANPDMVAHTGNIAATKKAIAHTDWAIGEIVETVLARGGTVFLTADHGNAEELITYPSTSFFFTSDQGSVNTDHSNNPVPFVVMAKELEGKELTSKRGALSDVAPTILTYMKLPIPSQMTGKNLLQ